MKLNNLTIKTAREGLKNKQFSSVDLVSAYIEQIKTKNASLNAFITVCESQALEKAKAADELIKASKLLRLPTFFLTIFRNTMRR
jgi:aspartyl-tRNA(Asn)/glutamyl-tRNA(Gln) amidotransferase subunit A